MASGTSKIASCDVAVGGKRSLGSDNVADVSKGEPLK